MWSAEMFCVATTSIIIILAQCLLYWRWKQGNYNGRLHLPPGSSGLPLIGETLELLIPAYSLDLHPFIEKESKGMAVVPYECGWPGQDIIVSADPDFNHFLYQQEGKLVERSYLDLFKQLFKPEDFNANDLHRYVRKVTLSQFGLECMREQHLLCRLEEFICKTLHSWSLRDSVELISASVLEIFGDLGIKQLFGDMENSKDLSQKLLNFSTAALSFPLNIPGTTYHRCIKDKDEALKMIGGMVKARLGSPDMKTDDLLGRIIAKDMNRVNFLSEEVITQMLFGLLFGASETIVASRISVASQSQLFYISRGCSILAEYRAICTFTA